MDEPALYEIRIAEQLDARWTEWFGGLEIVSAAECDETILRGEIADQPALFGLLGKVRDLGLTLLAVQRLRSPTRLPDSQLDQLRMAHPFR